MSPAKKIRLQNFECSAMQCFSIPVECRSKNDSWSLRTKNSECSRLESVIFSMVYCAGMTVPQEIFFNAANCKHTSYIASSTDKFDAEMSAFFNDLISIIGILRRSSVRIPFNFWRYELENGLKADTLSNKNGETNVIRDENRKRTHVSKNSHAVHRSNNSIYLKAW